LAQGHFQVWLKTFTFIEAARLGLAAGAMYSSSSEPFLGRSESAPDLRRSTVDDFRLSMNSASGHSRDRFPKGAWVSKPTGRKFGHTDLSLATSKHPKWSTSREFQNHWSHATTFGREPFCPGGGLTDLYVRDPHSGVWLRQKPVQRDRVLSPLPGVRLEMNTMSNMCVSLKRQPMFHGCEQRDALIRPGCK